MGIIITYLFTRNMLDRKFCSYVLLYYYYMKYYSVIINIDINILKYILRNIIII